METDRDALYDLCSLNGKLRFDRRKHVTHIYVEPHKEPPSISTPYADNNSRRWDSAELTLRLVDDYYHPVRRRFKRNPHVRRK